jgi:hypothetical protein
VGPIVEFKVKFNAVNRFASRRPLNGQIADRELDAILQNPEMRRRLASARRQRHVRARRRAEQLIPPLVAGNALTRGIMSNQYDCRSGSQHRFQLLGPLADLLLTLSQSDELAATRLKERLTQSQQQLAVSGQHGWRGRPLASRRRP